MSREGIELVSRVGLVVVLIIVTAVMRTLVGPSKRRGFYITLGTLGGMTCGVAAASLLALDAD